MASPSHYSHATRIEAKRGFLLDVARQYAWGAATAGELCAAAKEYGEAVQDAPERVRVKEEAR